MRLGLRLLILLLVLSAGISLSAPAASEDYPYFENASENARYQELIRQIRCLVCQGQSIAESNADLAKDLRGEVQRMILGGRSDGEIIDFLVARYGDFVLYRPPVKPATWLLWGGPFLLLALAVAVMLALARRSREAGASELTGAERQRLEAALHGHGRGDDEGRQ